MGRNPVVGRQGPAHHAAIIPAESEAKRLRVKQIRSGIGHAETMNRTLKSIGLRHHQATVEVDNNATMRGMLTKVRHLIEVSPVQEI
ncbi:MAG: 50S ribosomal protein L30 [Gemmatimonadales bacterium]|jgi:large subunit ribosomal protein L30|nr:50S ribosomal protein L30 [Gemmatimonadales bacterium]MDZ4258201.1 50S ribosomal protein L30 [Gemmatimonadales bacterium]MDZ4388260.1 50S ribosomal protein L30 [Gemmatimonadales bacterium]